MRKLWIALVITAVLLVMIGSASPMDLLFALAISAAIIIPLPIREPRGRVRIRGLPLLALGTLLELLRGSLGMLLVLIGRRTWTDSGVVEVPFEDRSDLGVEVSA